MTTPAAPSAPAPAAPAEPTPTAPTATPGSFLGSAPAQTAPASPASTPGTPPRFFGESIAKDGIFQEGWTQNLQQMGFERLANKAALAKDEGTLFKSLDDALGLVGKKAGIAYPKPGADEAAIAAFRQDAGVPDSPEGYKLKPEKLPEGITWDDATNSAYAKILHEHHVPAAAAEALVAAHLNQLVSQTQAAQQEFAQQLSAKVELAETTFQKEWGAEYQARREANAAFVHSRFTPEELSDPTLQAALSHPSVIRIIDDARISLREAPLPGVGHEASMGSRSPGQQAQEIIKANPNYDKDPVLHKRVLDLYNLEAAQRKRAGKR